MVRPAVHDTTEQVYARLPAFYRTADATLDWPLLRYLSLLGDQLGEITDLADRIDYVAEDDGGAPGETSDLADPDSADVAWLTWIAQFVGVTLDPEEPIADQRAHLAAADAEIWARGSRAHLRGVVEQLLTGGQYVRITTHHGGSPWVVSIETLPDETPDATWADIEQDTPTWAHIEAADTWHGVTSEDVFIATQPLRPAGVDFHLRPYSATYADVDRFFATVADAEAAVVTVRDLRTYYVPA